MMFGPDQSLRVLIVDDDPKICKILTTFLERTNRFENIVTAENVSIALLKIRNEEFDLIIVDYQMPNKKGTDLIEMVNNSLLSKRPKFLLISGFLDQNAVGHALQLGVKNILVKPFNRSKLLDKIYEVFR
ncbi:MAG: response regulator [Bacteriovoracaceae bacterium]|nr:response regulator [Bacteriovoracaceae bacterium]